MTSADKRTEVLYSPAKQSKVTSKQSGVKNSIVKHILAELSEAYLSKD